MSTILVYVDHAGGAPIRASLEALGAAHASGAKVLALVTGSGSESCVPILGGYGASRVVLLAGDGHSPDATAAGIAAAAREHGAQAVLAAANSAGKDLVPRVAAHLDAALFSDCIVFEASGDGFRVKRPWLAGKCIATLTAPGQVVCATTRVNVFSAVETGGTAEVIQAPAAAEPKAVRQSIEAKEQGKLDVKEASIVVTGGRGLKEPENFKLVEDLAAAFGGRAAVGASRAVVDAGWRPHAEQVGQTGKTVAPQLYFAIGISGAIQHLAGMRTSKVIVAINKDADAPIFKVADYGIVGDALEILPALTVAIKNARA